MSLWPASEAAEATGGRVSGVWQAAGLSIDPANLRAGDLYLAMHEPRSDGLGRVFDGDSEEALRLALSNGAVAAMIGEAAAGELPRDLAAALPLLVVRDVIGGLFALARAARARSSARLVAVTGAVGKSTTLGMLSLVLGHQGTVFAVESERAAVNGGAALIRALLSLAHMPRETDFALLEIDPDDPARAAALSGLARPDLLVITTIRGAQTRADSADLPETTALGALGPGTAAIFSGDLPQARVLRERLAEQGARALTFGEGPGNHHRLLRTQLTEEATICEARAWRARMLYKISAPGRHYARDGLAVLLTAFALNLDRAVAVSDLGRWTPPPGKGLRERRLLDVLNEAVSFDLIDDAGMADADSMAAALDVLAASHPRNHLGRFSRGRRIAILGGLEDVVPGAEDRAQDQLAELPAMAAVDLVHCVGQATEHLYRQLPYARRGRHVETAAELAKQARRLVDAGDVVLVKGSADSRVSLVVDAMRKLGHPAAQQ